MVGWIVWMLGFETQQRNAASLGNMEKRAIMRSIRGSLLRAPLLRACSIAHHSGDTCIPNYPRFRSETNPVPFLWKK